MMSGPRDPKNVMRYDHGRENLDLTAVNFIVYEEPGGVNGIHLTRTTAEHARPYGGVVAQFARASVHQRLPP